jgi:ABC-2 type transport system ATP-binding protein
MSESFIKIKGLTKQYKQATEPALNNLDLEIAKDSVFGLLGPNGAGKTTTISIICNQIKADSGKVIIAGNDLTTEKEKIKKIIGVVPQDIALYPNLTAYENLKFFGNMYGLSGTFLKQRIVDCMTNFGLEHKLNQKIKTFSGGMKRRVNLIAGILHKPQILILDEPTVGIDVQSKNVILEHLQNLNIVEGTTIIYTSHLMEEAEKFCTQIGIIDEGRLIATGNPKAMIEEYKTCEKLEDIYLLLTGRSLRD